MKGIRSSRGAAVVLAGCVGLAVMAPGIAAASTPPATFCDVPLVDSTCPTGGSGSTSNETSTPDTAVPEATTPDAATPDPTTPDATTPDATAPGSTAPGSTAPGSTAPGSTAPGSSTVTPPGTGPAGLLPSTEGGTGSAGLPSQSAATGGTGDTAVVTEKGEDLQKQINALAPAGVDPGDITGFLPGTGNLDLGNLPPVTTIPAGGFTNPQDACAYLAGGLTVPAGQEASVGSAFESFCGSLPTQFGLGGLGDLTGLFQDFLDLLNGLLPGAGGNGTSHSTVPPSYVPVYYHGYWTSRYDVDCADLTYDEAQTLLSYDRSDPFRLDANHDGTACEVNRHSSSDADDSDDGYPEGGVSTGDGSTTTEASPAMLALAAAGVSGLALAGVGLVRRFGRES